MLPAPLIKPQTSQFSLSVFHQSLLPTASQVTFIPSSPLYSIHGRSYLSKQIMIWLSLPSIRIFDRPQLSRGWSLNSLARHSRPCTVHCEPVFQPIPHHPPRSIPNSSPTACSQQSGPPAAPSALPENLSSYPSPVYLVNSSATSLMVPFSPSIPLLLLNNSPSATLKNFLYTFAYLGILCKYCLCARHLIRNGNKIKPGWNTHSALIQ